MTKPDFIISIDVGLSGGICLYECRTKTFVLHAMPTVSVKSKKGIKREVDFAEVYNTLKFFKGKETDFVFEKLQGIFGVSKKSSVSLANQVGHFRAFAIALGLNKVEIPPKTWQTELFKGITKTKRLGKGGKDKTAIVNDTKQNALLAYKKLLPHLQVPKTARGKVLDGCIDAALIAIYQLKKYTQ